MLQKLPNVSGIKCRYEITTLFKRFSKLSHEILGEICDVCINCQPNTEELL